MKQTCEYCGGHTHDDKRGNCAGCGAPRTKPPDVLDRYAMSRQKDQQIAEMNTAVMMVTVFPFQYWASQIKPWNTNGGGS